MARDACSRAAGPRYRLPGNDQEPGGDPGFPSGDERGAAGARPASKSASSRATRASSRPICSWRLSRYPFSAVKFAFMVALREKLTRRGGRQHGDRNLLSRVRDSEGFPLSGLPAASHASGRRHVGAGTRPRRAGRGLFFSID